MSGKIKLTILDHVNFHLDGLSKKEILNIQKATSLPIKGAFTQAAYKAKIWDGRESFFNDEGFGFLYELDDILSILEEMGYDLDSDIDFSVERNEQVPEVPFIDESFLELYTGHKLRDYQYNSVNSVIQYRRGLLDIGTNGGKSFICVALSKVFDSHYKSVVIVPSDFLVKQTYADYKKTDLDVFALTAKTPVHKRKQEIDNHRHIILTSKLFINHSDLFTNEEWVLMVDEAHQFGDVFADCIRTDMAHCPIRVGMTATLPKEKIDPYKRKKIINHIGGDILESVRQKELISRGISSKLSIRMFQTYHEEIEELSKTKEFDWSIEENYLLNNIDRIQAIANFIKKFPVKNTLILCQPSLGIKLSEILGCDMIVDEVKSQQRTEWFENFNNRDDYILAGSFDCVGTGISNNRIFRQFTIDVGKNPVHIIQGIGRALRRDGVYNEAEVIDISARTKYSLKHKKERLKIYKEEEFSWVEENERIEVC